jgi:hypothetical protein
MGWFNRAPLFAASVWRGNAMNICSHPARVLVLFTLISVRLVMPAAAQSTVTARYDTRIWSANFQTVVTEVKRGTVLTVVSTRDEWVEVVVPGREGAARQTGFIFASSLEGQGVNAREATGGAAVSTPAAAPAASTEPSSSSPRAVAVRGFGQFGYTSFAAADSFSAVLGDSGGLMLGAGAEVRFAGGLFVSGAFERFNKVGQRAFVFDGEVYQLGITNTVTVAPLTVSAGWRFEKSFLTPYGGGGFGRVGYKEFSDFAEDDENVDETYSSYHVLGGVELRNGWVATAFEAQYTQVPDALGAGGVSAAFHEDNLGGFTMRVKVLVGR